jgi:hypothetical protein
MAKFKKKPDPISERARALNEEIAALQAQIKNLDSQSQLAHGNPRLRSTALPHGATISHPQETPPPVSTEPIFEEVDQDRLKAKSETVEPEHFNELGVRKYDLPSLLRRIRNHFRGPSTPNPKLVNYLAAGGIQGLRPMRYEKRVARNRFIVLIVFLFFMLLGIFMVFKRH